MKKNIRFQRVEKKNEHIRLLFELLSDRQFSISHTLKPSYQEHSIFVKSDPYRAWYFVFWEQQIIGSFYLTNNNSIGLNFRHQDVDIIRTVLIYVRKNYQPLVAVPSIVPPYFSINVAYANKELMDILRDFNCEEIQTTYKFD